MRAARVSGGDQAPGPTSAPCPLGRRGCLPRPPPSVPAPPPPPRSVPGAPGSQPFPAVGAAAGVREAITSPLGRSDEGLCQASQQQAGMTGALATCSGSLSPRPLSLSSLGTEKEERGALELEMVPCAHGDRGAACGRLALCQRLRPSGPEGLPPALFCFLVSLCPRPVSLSLRCIALAVSPVCLSRCLCLSLAVSSPSLPDCLLFLILTQDISAFIFR